MSTEKPYSSFFDFAPTSAPQECIQTLNDISVNNTARVFAKNFDDIVSMFAFPVQLTYVSLTGQRQMITFMEACMRGHLSAARYGRDPEVTKRINAEMEKIRTTEAMNWIGGEARKILLPFMRNPEITKGVRVFFSSLLSASWTAFEAMASDLWTACVNSRPTQLGKQTIFGLPQKPSGSDKYISLRFLSKHNFDLRSSLGEVLVKKFDFTSLSGIAKAYKLAFPKLGTKDILDSPDLKLLQSYRHVIVHRAGIADQSFIETTRLPDVAPEQPIPLDDKSVERMINAAGESGSRLIVLVDQWLTQHPL
jgi:hypothetical protein